MLEGLWTLEFRSSIGNTGYGTVTFDGKKARRGTGGKSNRKWRKCDAPRLMGTFIMISQKEGYS